MCKQSVGVVSLGCSKNRVDTETMLGLLRAAGHPIVQDAAKAEVIIINTCGFIESAKQESIDTILEYARYKAAGSCKKLVVTGCLSERYREALGAELPEVDLLLGVREYQRLPGLLQGQECKSAPAPRLLTTPAYSAYLRIADGCSNRCAYCAIPLIRGPLRSVPQERLLEEARALTAGGVTELVLIAQDTSGYGVDLYGQPRLLPLMQALAGLPGLRWLRLMYTYPDTVTPALLELMQGQERICAYLDMPLQHCNDAVLQRMNRRGKRAELEALLTYIRDELPHFILRTTAMVGFPGETEAQFEELLAFLREYPFDRLGAFAYSPEEDTPAAAMPNQVPEQVAQQRLHTLLQQQKRISKERNARRIGNETLMLVEQVSERGASGRSYGEAPEVDGKLIIPGAAGLSPGQYLPVRITAAAGDYDLYGELLSPERGVYEPSK